MNSARRATELALILIKAAPLRSAAPGHARTGLRPWGADPVQRPGPLASGQRMFYNEAYLAVCD